MAEIEQGLTTGPLGAMGFQASPRMIDRAPGAATIDSLVDAWNTRVASADDRRA